MSKRIKNFNETAYNKEIVEYGAKLKTANDIKKAVTKIAENVGIEIDYKMAKEDLMPTIGNLLNEKTGWKNPVMSAEAMDVKEELRFLANNQEVIKWSDFNADLTEIKPSVKDKIVRKHTTYWSEEMSKSLTDLNKLIADLNKLDSTLLKSVDVDKVKGIVSFNEHQFSYFYDERQRRERRGY